MHKGGEKVTVVNKKLFEISVNEKYITIQTNLAKKVFFKP